GEGGVSTGFVARSPIRHSDPRKRRFGPLRHASERLVYVLRWPPFALAGVALPRYPARGLRRGPCAIYSFMTRKPLGATRLARRRCVTSPAGRELSRIGRRATTSRSPLGFPRRGRFLVIDGQCKHWRFGQPPKT